MEKTNNDSIDIYLTDNFKGKSLSTINKFLASLYDDFNWKGCFFQKKPPSYQKIPDIFWMITNSEAKICIVIKVIEIRQIYRSFSPKQNDYTLQSFDTKNFLIECVYSKPIYFDIHNIDEVIIGIQSILGD